MASQSDKLLFEVELLPPDASNIKTVSQAINRVTRAQDKQAKSTRNATKASQQQKSIYDKLKTDIRELETNTKRAENATRFGNQTQEQSVKITKAQLVQLEKLQKEIKQTNLTRKQQAKLMNLVETKRKTMNRSMGRVQEGWSGLSNELRHGNRLLMQSGRILQDLPFGFMGISNNIQQLVMSFGRASNKGMSFTQMLSQMGSSLMGTGGLIFLLGSALPFAMQVATNGFIGFESIMGDSKKEAKDLKGAVGDLIGSLKELRGLEGEDPLGIKGRKAKLESIKDVLTPIRDINERITTLKEVQVKQTQHANLETKGLIGGHRVALQLAEKRSKEQDGLIAKLRNEKESVRDRFNLTEEEVKLLQDKSKALEEQLKKRKALLKVSPMLREQQNISERVGRVMGQLDAGIDVGLNRLQDTATFIDKRIAELRRQVASGEIDPTKGSQQINFLLGQLDKLEERIDEGTMKVTEGVSDMIAKDNDALVSNLEEDEDRYTEFTKRQAEERAEKYKELNKERKKLAKERQSFLRQMADKRFKARQDSLGDLVALEITTQGEIQDIRERAMELGIWHEERVQSAITAIRQRAVRKRTEMEEKREKQLRDAKFKIWSQTASFIDTVNSNILGNSKAVALIQLAIEKGLQIAKVASKTSEKVSDLQQMAGVAGAKASMETAKATSALASGNIVKAGMHTTASGKFRQAQASATAQAGKIGGIGAKTIALIAGQTLAKGAGILSGGGSGGSGGGSGGGGGATGGGAGKSDLSEGFEEFDAMEPMGGIDALGSAVIEAITGMKKQELQPIYLNMNGDLDSKAMSIEVEEGRKQRESNARVITSDI